VRAHVQYILVLYYLLWADELTNRSTQSDAATDHKTVQCIIRDQQKTTHTHTGTDTHSQHSTDYRLPTLYVISGTREYRDRPISTASASLAWSPARWAGRQDQTEGRSLSDVSSACPQLHSRPPRNTTVRRSINRHHQQSNHASYSILPDKHLLARR